MNGKVTTNKKETPYKKPFQNDNNKNYNNKPSTQYTPKNNKPYYNKYNNTTANTKHNSFNKPNNSNYYNKPKQNPTTNSTPNNSYVKQYRPYTKNYKNKGSYSKPYYKKFEEPVIPSKPIIKKAKYMISIRTTANNIFLTALDSKNSVVSTFCTGYAGFKGPARSTPYAAEESANQFGIKLMKRFKEKKIDSYTFGIMLRSSPNNQLVQAALRGIKISGLPLRNLVVRVSVPHNGMRSKKLRRV